MTEFLNSANNLYAFAYVLAMSAASPAPIMEAALGSLHKGRGGRVFGPLLLALVDSITGAGEAANIVQA